MGSKKLVTLAVCAAAVLAPTAAHATTVTLGAHEFPTTGGPSYSCNVFGPCSPGFTVAQLSSPGLVEVAPASGLITSWRIRGSGSPGLHVLKPTAEGEWAGDGATGVATDQSGGPNAVRLPIQAGDLIGVDLPESGALVRYVEAKGSGAEVITFTPIVEEGVGQYEEFSASGRDSLLLLSADVVLAPVVGSLSPAVGSTAGGNAVTITGQYLDGATGVSFGSSPASSFSVDSSSQITAIAPAAAPATVDVRVTGPGGSSEVGPADRYTFVALATTTGTGSLSSLLATPPFAVVAKPSVSGFVQSASRWRRGKGLPHIAASGAPVGTTFSFTLNEPASVSFVFSQRRPGRRVRGRCVAVTPGNAGKARCRRTVKAGSFSLPGHQGLNKASFQGRLTSSKALKPGTYAVSIVASDAHGLRGVSPLLGFTIVAG
jgi:IPT/TIG domain